MFGTRSYIIVTFAFLFWLYFVLSGGSTFEPETWPEPVPSQQAEAPAPAAPTPATLPPVEIAQADPTPVEPEPQSPQSDLPAPPVVAETPLDTDAAVAEALAGFDPNAVFSLETPVSGDIALSPETSPPAPQEVAPEPEQPPADLRRIAASRVNIRGGSSTDFEVLVTLDQDTVVTVLSVADNGWLEIALPDGSGNGWVLGSLLEPVAQ